MEIETVKIKALTSQEFTLLELLDRYIQKVSDRSILVITSKEELIAREAEKFLPVVSCYGVTLSIKGGRLIPTAGIDESNGNGQYILWPRKPYESAWRIQKYISQRFKLRQVGVLITDSTTAPLRFGTAGVCIGHAGFHALNSYIGRSDIFGRKLEVTKSNIADGLAAAAVVVMGEGSERTPLAIITGIPFVKFANQRVNPDLLRIRLADDLYAPILENVKWQRGGGLR